MRKADKKIKPDLMSLNKLSTLRLSKEELLANKKVLEEAKKIPRQVVVLPTDVGVLLLCVFSLFP